MRRRQAGHTSSCRDGGSPLQFRIKGFRDSPVRVLCTWQFMDVAEVSQYNGVGRFYAFSGPTWQRRGEPGVALDEGHGVALAGVDLEHVAQ